MMNREKNIAVAVAILIVWASWLFRYDVQQRSASGPAIIVMLDRWTGSVYVSWGKSWEEIK